MAPTPDRPSCDGGGGPSLRFDPTSLDLTDVDLDRFVRAAAASTERAGSRAFELARDATYVTVGLGVLNFQRLQVRRRELERRFR